MKKELVLGLLSVVIIALILVIGGKLYINNKENKNLEKQRYIPKLGMELMGDFEKFYYF